MTLLVASLGERARVTLDGPHHNAIDVATWRALRSAFGNFAKDQSLRCVEVTGAGGHFAAGADISEFAVERRDLASVRHYHEEIIAPALDAIWRCPCPVIAKIEGDCVGGGLEIAACCDLRYASHAARFGVPIGRLGFSMAPDEMAALLRVAGPAVSAELLLEGRLLSAGEALARGLISRSLPAAELGAEVDAAITRICSQAPLALRINKRLLRELSNATLGPAEREFAFSYAETRDHAEGVRAFIEKRVPKFQNR
jgi:enoyl-CoA hydratase/carnithine racemase